MILIVSIYGPVALRQQARHGLQAELAAPVHVPRRAARVGAAEAAEVAAVVGH